MEFYISSLYWINIDNSSLFHYQGDKYISSSLFPTTTTSIYINNDRKELIDNDNNNCEYLFSLTEENNHWFINRNIQSNKDFWVVLKYSYLHHPKGHCLHEGDVIRLGKIKFKIIEARITKENLDTNSNNNEKSIKLKEYQKHNIIQPSQHGSVFAFGDNDIKPKDTFGLDSNRKINTLDFVSIEKNRNSFTSANYVQFTCRICFGDSNQDLLINICNCTGSVKYIHLKCLWKWIVSKGSFRTHNNLSLFSYKNLQCELCHCDIPEVIMINDNLLYLYQPYNILSAISENEEIKHDNFLALEHLKEPIEGNNNQDKKTIYIINFNEMDTLTLGRSNQADVQLIDSSINDFHAKIEIHDKKIYINDLNTKYGTHLRIDPDDHLPISTLGGLGLQFGKYFFGLEFRKKWYWCCKNMFSCNKDNSVNQSNLIEEYFEEKAKNKYAIDQGYLSTLKNVDIYDKEIEANKPLPIVELMNENNDIRFDTPSNNKQGPTHVVVHSNLEDVHLQDEIRHTETNRNLLSSTSIRILSTRRNNNEEISMVPTQQSTQRNRNQNSIPSNPSIVIHTSTQMLRDILPS